MKVTIGLPFYNNEATLRYAINSVLAQTYSNFELLLINDGSTDNSRDIALSYTDSRIIVYDDGKNEGLSVRLNEVISRASGNYIARMDADDIMHPQRIEKQLSYLISHPSIDLIGSSAYIIDGNNKVTGIRLAINTNTSIKEVVQKGLFIHPTVMGRTEWFINNRYNTSLKRSEDYDLWVRSFCTSSFSALSEPLLFYREISAQHYNKYVKTQKEKLKLLKSYRGRYITQTFAASVFIQIAAKIVIYSIANMLNKVSHLTNNRNASMGAEAKEQAQRILLNVLKGSNE